MNLFLLADADPMSAILSSPSFKAMGAYVLIGIAVLAMFYPSLLAKLKTGLASLIDKQLHDRLPAVLDNPLHNVINGGSLFGPNTGAQLPQPITPSQLQGDVGQIVQQRATALKAACPKAPSDLRLKWLEQGFDTLRAQADYISVLESKVDTQIGSSTTPAV